VPDGGFGTAVVITGTNLDDATAVTFNGKAATFTNVSSTEIDTVVPVGAPKGHGTGAKAGIQVSNVFGTSTGVAFTSSTRRRS
jgi:IPT/TIG domain.